MILIGRPKLSEAELEQRAISKAEKVEQRVIYNAERKAVNKEIAKALKKGNGKERNQYNERLLAEKRQLTIESQKPLLAFMKEYYQEHYYFSSKGLANAYGNLKLREATPISLILAFGRILGDLRNLGVIEKHNTQVYRKVINPESY